MSNSFEQVNLDKSQADSFDKETCDALRQQYDDIQDGKRPLPKGAVDKESTLEMIDALIKFGCAEAKPEKK